jgi:hypothetical protein
VESTAAEQLPKARDIKTALYTGVPNIDQLRIHE